MSNGIRFDDGDHGSYATQTRDDAEGAVELPPVCSGIWNCAGTYAAFAGFIFHFFQFFFIFEIIVVYCPGISFLFMKGKIYVCSKADFLKLFG